jgi:phospholipid/cholesterol/gamma-HCH transport system permease protein
MSDLPANQTAEPRPAVVRVVERVGNATLSVVDAGAQKIRYLGGMTYLVGDCFAWIYRSLVKREVRLGSDHLLAQMVRVGLKSIPIIAMVEAFIGVILALQMAPTMQKYGQLQQIATIVAIAMTRELGPLISGIVLSGFAGASIAAELGTMVEGEEIKALRAHALNPIRFLVLPRFLATVIMLTLLIVIADVVGVIGGLLVGTQILGIGFDIYLATTRLAITSNDFLSGVAKGPLFGLLISMIACYEGLNVSGGAAGVGRATTNTVVKCIVALISADVIVTSLLYAYGI